tara:strand:- start:182 stop:364 length:183 start_codon:yes stop_codon:yes gene_type:complete
MEKYMKKWDVIDTESSAMRSFKEVIATFETLKEAVALSETDTRFRVTHSPDTLKETKEIE